METKTNEKVLKENAVGYANEPTDQIAKRVIDNSLNDFVNILASKLIELEKSGVVLTSSDLLTAMNSYFNMNVAEKVVVGTLTAMTFQKTGISGIGIDVIK